MDKFTRNQRICLITKYLTENPNKVINLSIFTDAFNAAKSTVSEDLLIIKDMLLRFGEGRIETIAGASGGVKYVSKISDEESKLFVQKLCSILNDKDRIISGSFIYTTDIMCNPDIIKKAASILSSKFEDMDIDYVVTVETKGIPLAFEVSKILGKQLVVVRRENKITEGSSVTINYMSGSTDRIQNMILSKKALAQGSKCIFIDDFMRGGGTAQGIMSMLKEFECTLCGIGVLIDKKNVSHKLVNDYVSIVDFYENSENNLPAFKPSKIFL